MLTPSTVTDETAGRLFREFARTEYALKASGFVKAGGAQAAESDWEKFAQQFGDKLWTDQQIQNAVRYMSEKPPQRQIVQNGHLCWRDGEKASDGATLLRCVRRIRNNLFHGGKEHRSERDELLMLHSLEILAACLRASPGLKSAFESAD